MIADPPLRVVQIMLAKGFGGAERSFVDLCLALARRGHQVTAIGERRGVALGALGADPVITRRSIRVMGSWDPVAAWQLRRILRQLKPDVVQTHLARASAIGGAAARALGLPVLAKTHNYVKLAYYRHVDCLVPTTAGQYEYLRRAGIAPGRLRPIPNFSSIPAVTEPRSEAGSPPVAVALGRFVPKKGFDVLLRAFATVTATGVAARLIMAGSGPEEPSLHALAARLGIAAAIDFPGWIEDVAGLLQQADLFVLPSRDEPFGIVVLEAMALGIPIVATRTAGPSEILDETSARLVEVDDEQGLAGAIADVLRDRPAALERARRALARFRDRYSEAAVVPEYETLYRVLARGR